MAPDTPGLDAVPALGAGRLRDSCALLVATARSDPGALVERGVQLFLTASALLQVGMSALESCHSRVLVKRDCAALADRQHAAASPSFATNPCSDIDED